MFKKFVQEKFVRIFRSLKIEEMEFVQRGVVIAAHNA